MINADGAPTGTTEDGERGIVLEWPAGSSKYFRILRAHGTEVEHVPVTAILLPTGEVKLQGPTYHAT